MPEEKERCSCRCPAAKAFMGASIIIASLIFSIAFYRTRSADNAIRVTGSATKTYQADVLKWKLSFARTTGLNELSIKHANEQLEKDYESVCAYLAANGIGEKDIQIQPTNSESMWGRDGVSGYRLQKSLVIIPKDMAKTEKLALSQKALMDKGIAVSSSLEYYFADLQPIKRELLAEATKDAKKRADEIAKSSGIKAGSLVSAKTGVFQITEPYSTETSNSGIYSTSTKTKDITITVNAAFEIN